MGKMNGIRVLVTLLGIAALGWSILCPWWLCRTVDDGGLLAQMDEWRQFPNLAVGIAETKVKMVPLWRIKKEYGLFEWLPFNAIQLVAVCSLWAWGLRYARDFDAGDQR